MHQLSESQTKVTWSAIFLKIVIFIRFCTVNGQGMPVQLICHTKPYNNRTVDDASRYFGVWLWQLVHLLILVCSFQWCVLFLCLAKLHRSCPIRDKGLLRERVPKIRRYAWDIYSLNGMNTKVAPRIVWPTVSAPAAPAASHTHEKSIIFNFHNSVLSRL